MLQKIQTITDLADKLIAAKKKYSYQTELTTKLDSVNGDFNEITILEIVLWKLNRYPNFTKDILNDINRLRQGYSEEKAENVLRKMLSSKGFDLPMASTVLSFACPKHLQIIDQRVYRIITPGEDVLKIPYSIEKKIEFYFDYLKKLKSICDEYNICFTTSDRVLYQLDKNINASVNIKH